MSVILLSTEIKKMEQAELHFMDTVSLMKGDKWWEYTETDKVWSLAF